MNIKRRGPLYPVCAVALVGAVVNYHWHDEEPAPADAAGAPVAAMIQATASSSASMALHVALTGVWKPDAILDCSYCFEPVLGALIRATGMVQSNQPSNGKKLSITLD